MFKNFGKRLVVAGLIMTKYVMIILCVPLVILFMYYGFYFVVAAFLWIILIEAVCMAGLLIFTSNVLMVFVAIFDAEVWQRMGDMWNWLWGWFAGGNIMLWPHLMKSFPPYFVTGVVFLLLYEGAQYLNIKKINMSKQAITLL